MEHDDPAYLHLKRQYRAREIVHDKDIYLAHSQHGTHLHTYVWSPAKSDPSAQSQ